MYIAKIQGKSYNEGRLWVNVEFTDGVDSIIEGIGPQDENQLKLWVKEKLHFLNTSKDSILGLTDGSIINIKESTPNPIVISEEVGIRNTWLTNYNKWVKVKTTLIDTGILTGSETPLVNLKNKVKADFLPDYIKYI